MRLDLEGELPRGGENEAGYLGKRSLVRVEVVIVQDFRDDGEGEGECFS